MKIPLAGKVLGGMDLLLHGHLDLLLHGVLIDLLLHGLLMDEPLDKLVLHRLKNSIYTDWIFTYLHCN